MSTQAEKIISFNFDFGGTFDGTEGLLLAQCLEVTPGSTLGTNVSRIELETLACKACAPAQ